MTEWMNRTCRVLDRVIALLPAALLLGLLFPQRVLRPQKRFH